MFTKECLKKALQKDEPINAKNKGKINLFYLN